MGGQARGMDVPAERLRDGLMVTRRKWLAGGAVGCLTVVATSLQAQSPKAKSALTADEEQLVAAVRARATKAGLGKLEVRWTDHFVGIGDAPSGYSADALKLCEAYAREFLEHFRRSGFRVDYPAHRMAVVLLKDAASFQAFIDDRSKARGAAGQYDVGSNQLLIFDMRPEQADLKAQGSDAERVNTFTLIHETAHMLCYNSGLVPAGRDVPVAIDEGLATYCEYWTPTAHRGPTTFGKLNEPRLVDLETLLDRGESWIPVATLLRDDELFHDPKTEHLAYAESWVLMRYLLRQPGMLPKFKSYLAGLPEQRAGRESHAKSAIGSLENLDQETRAYARQVRKRRR